MTTPQLHYLAGHDARITTHEWANTDARYLVLLLQGYGEHVGRYQHVARAVHPQVIGDVTTFIDAHVRR